MPPRLPATMVTTTTYGTGLPGDPARLERAAARRVGHPAFLSPAQQALAFAALRDDAAEFGYALANAVAGGSPTTRATFNGNHGQYPDSELTLLGDTGHGTTSYGGASNSGTVFALRPNPAVCRCRRNAVRPDQGHRVGPPPIRRQYKMLNSASK